MQQTWVNTTRDRSAVNGRWGELTLQFERRVIHVLSTATRKILIHVREQMYIQRLVREDLFSICDQVYSFRVIGIHSYACYVGGILCASAIVWHIFYLFCNLYETIKIKVRNIPCYMFLFVSETWFLILRNEYWLRAFNNVVVRKLNSISEEVMERTELHNSQFHVFTKWCLCSSERG